MSSVPHTPDPSRSVLRGHHPPRTGFAPAVAVVAGATVIVCVGIALLLPDAFNAVVGTINTTIVSSIGWYYIFVVSGFVAFAALLAFTRLGEITLGKDTDEPAYPLLSWFAMLFAAGMGIGLVFWGAAEPLSFFADKGAMLPTVAGEDEATRAEAVMAQAFLHWGLHAWAIFSVVGLAMGYAVHRKGRPMSIRWALEPLLGTKTNSWIGDVIDIIAVVGTLFGIATSLGFGVNQIFSGLVHLGVLPETQQWIKLLIVVVITGLATLSAASGLNRGIKILSNLNLGLAALLLVLMFILGPTLFLLREFVAGLGDYLQNLIRLSFQTLPFYGEEGATWISSWTAYYWGWWISWAPFVGVFIARISKGRTIREFIVGVLLVPTVIAVLWFTAFGGSGLHAMITQGVTFTQADGTINASTAMFQVLELIPGTPILSGITIVLVAVFFITSADSGALVIGMITHGGNQHPPVLSRLIWSLSCGLIAGVLLWVSLFRGGDTTGMSALQALSLIAALPFSVVMVAMVHAMYLSLRREVLMRERIEAHLRDSTTTPRLPSADSALSPSHQTDQEDLS